ncbi:hypothetical protein BCR42DRAFT_494226 [Absidia repens]|uniref:Uncharacterized protein n=1 Tax=Absidia repens TaxID=90262 RepID=A0A1X2I7W7_9FUNG|nr:hypothetical protein BCR42DRAFT_494226 [Absidia repens]
MLSPRFPSLLNAGLKSGMKSRPNQPMMRSYSTQENKPSSMAPLMIAGFFALGGIIYYSRHKDALEGGKKLDPSDRKGQEIQKETDKAIKDRQDSTGAVDLRGQSSDTIVTENTSLPGHPAATKKDAYVDPQTAAKQK